MVRPSWKCVGSRFTVDVIWWQGRERFKPLLSDFISGHRTGIPVFYACMQSSLQTRFCTIGIHQFLISAYSALWAYMVLYKFPLLVLIINAITLCPQESSWQPPSHYEEYHGSQNGSDHLHDGETDLLGHSFNSMRAQERNMNDSDLERHFANQGRSMRMLTLCTCVV